MKNKRTESQVEKFYFFIKSKTFLKIRNGGRVGNKEGRIDFFTKEKKETESYLMS